MAWYNNDWDYRVKITVGSSNIEADLEDYPVYLDLSNMASHFHSNAQSDGADIRITEADEVTEVPREVVSYNGTSQLGELHFKGASISASADTEFYLYYGNAGASDYSAGSSYGAQNVWDDNFIGVYHMGEDHSGSAPQISDSTSNANNGTAAGSMTTADLVGGQMGDAIEFDGSNDEIDIGDLDVMTAAPDDEFTLSCWLKWDGTGDTFATPIGLASFVGSYTYSSGAFAVQSQGDNSGEHLAADIDTDTWQRMSVQYIEGTKYLGYKGATNVFDVATTDTEGANAESAFIGDGSGSASGRHIGAIIDEVRISTVARSASWEFADYRNQSDTTSFYSLSTFEEQPGVTQAFGHVNPYRAILLNNNFYNVVPDVRSATPFRNNSYEINRQVEMDITLGSSPWYDTDWDYRIKITVGSSNIDSTVSDFPMYVDLSDLPADFHNNVASNGADIRVTSTDKETELPREVVFYNGTSQLGELHFKGDTLPSGTDQDFYIYYGNGAALDYAVGASYGRNNVWSNDYQAVYHLQNSYSGATNEVIDSTGNSHDGQGGGGTGSAVPAVVSGKLAGNGQDFDGNDWILLTESAGDYTDDFSISTWAKPDIDNSRPAVSRRSNSAGTQYDIYIDTTTDSFSFFDGTVYPGSVDIVTSPATWHHGFWVINGASSGVYSDASLDQTFTASVTSRALNANIGCWNDGDRGNFDGVIDEVRIHSVARTAEWVTAEYNNQSDTSGFYSLGSQEAQILVGASTTVRPTKRNVQVLGKIGQLFNVTLHLDNEHVVRAGATDIGSTTWLGVSQLDYLKGVVGASGESQPIYYVDMAGVTHQVVPTGNMDVSIYRPEKPSEDGMEFRVSLSLDEV